MKVDPNGNNAIWVIQVLLLPVLVYFAKKYGANIFKKYAKKTLKSKLQPIVNKHLKNYQIFFFPGGEVIFKIVKKHKGRFFLTTVLFHIKKKVALKNKLKLKVTIIILIINLCTIYIDGIKLIGKVQILSQK